MKPNLLVFNNGNTSTGLMDLSSVCALINSGDEVRVITRHGVEQVVPMDIGMNLYAAKQGPDVYTYVNEEKRPTFLVHVPDLVCLIPLKAPLQDKYFDIIVAGGHKFQIPASYGKDLLAKLQAAANKSPQPTPTGKVIS